MSPGIRARATPYLELALQDPSASGQHAAETVTICWLLFPGPGKGADFWAQEKFLCVQALWHGLILCPRRCVLYFQAKKPCAGLERRRTIGAMRGLVEP